MIQTLLSQVSELLQIELAGEAIIPDDHVVSLPIAKPEATSLPIISIYPNQLEINQQLKQSSLSQPHLQQMRQEIIISREFTQQFCLDIWESDLTNLEKLASLSSALILTNTDALIKEFNIAGKNKYQSGGVITTHLISHINWLNASYEFLENFARLQLLFQVIGQLQSAEFVEEGTVPIQTITLVQDSSQKY